MITECERRGLTEAGNYRAPTPTDCNKWVASAWEALKVDGVKKKAKELGMLVDPGPPVEGYVDNLDFVDAQPQGEEEVFADEDLLADLVASEQEE